MSVIEVKRTVVKPFSNVNIIGVLSMTGQSTGDGSGGVVTHQYYLGENTSLDEWFIITSYGYYVNNTGVAYYGYLQTLYLSHEENQADAIGNRCLGNDALLDNGSFSSVSKFDQRIVAGHKYGAGVPQITMTFVTNTNTKTYNTFIKGFVIKGFPMILSDRLPLI